MSCDNRGRPLGQEFGGFWNGDRGVARIGTLGMRWEEAKKAKRKRSVLCSFTGLKVFNGERKWMGQESERQGDGTGERSRLPPGFPQLSRHHVSLLLPGVCCNFTCIFLVPPPTGVFKVIFNYCIWPCQEYIELLGSHMSCKSIWWLSQDS